MANGLIVCGVDPGLGGGIVALSGDRILLAERMPVRTLTIGKRTLRITDGDAVARLVAGARPDACYIEEAHGRGNRPGIRGDGPSQAFTFGGQWWVLIDRLWSYDPVIVTPRQWQRSMLVLRGRVNRDDTKAAAIRYCEAFLPGLDLTPGRLKTPHEGLADAACLASYGYLQAVGTRNVGRLTRGART